MTEQSTRHKIKQNKIKTKPTKQAKHQPKTKEASEQMTIKYQILW